MGDHAWGLMQTAPNSMRPSSVGTSKIRIDDPGLQTVAGGQYSYRPRTPTRPSNSSAASPNLHLRKTCAMAARSPRSYIVKTRRASLLGTPHESQINSQGQPQQPQQDLQTAGGSRIPVEHYINIMRDSVHRIGQTADQIIDQLCFTSRRAQLDALFRLCPSIDFVEAGKVGPSEGRVALSLLSCYTIHCGVAKGSPFNKKCCHLDFHRLPHPLHYSVSKLHTRLKRLKG